MAACTGLSRHGRVSFLACRGHAGGHEMVTQQGVAARLAALLGRPFHAGPLSLTEALARGEGAGPAGDARVHGVGAETGELGYLVPNDTLVSTERARRLGIRDEADLFGGVVPHPVVASKLITHGLVHRGAHAPEGWREAFARRVEDAVLPGWSAFTADDARTAFERLRPGSVRLKLGTGIGGTGQWVVDERAQLEARLAALDPAWLAAHGVVLERNLARLRTYSIGRLRVGALEASYFGQQHATRDRSGAPVYGGSTLDVVRGGFDALERHAAAAGDAELACAVRQARRYHDTAHDCFEGLLASRSNYDVAAGTDAEGRVHAGVLEQSWRIGGASGAEVAALEVLCADPSRERVRAATVEVHDLDVAVPAGAVVYFRGVDDRIGPITKYACLGDPPAPR